MQISLANLVFPIYFLGTKKPEVDGKIIYYIGSKYTDETGNTYRVSVVDDKSISGTTLAARRLVLASSGVVLRKINKAAFFISDFIKLARPNMWCIDSLGQLFRYKKTKTVPLTYHKIAKLIPLPQGGLIVEVEGIPGRYKTLLPLTEQKTYAGMLRDGLEYTLYGLYDKKYDNSVRKI